MLELKEQGWADTKKKMSTIFAEPRFDWIWCGYYEARNDYTNDSETVLLCKICVCNRTSEILYPDNSCV